MKSMSTSPRFPEFALLGLLTQHPAHGYELHHRLSADLGQVWRTSLSQSYNLLNRLESQGYISGEILEPDRLPARRLFSVTEAGRVRFEAWLRAPTGPSVRAIRVEFTTRLYFARSIDPGLAQALIDEQEAELQSGLARLRKELAGLPAEQTFNRLGLELRIRQLESLIGWLEACRQAVAPASAEQRAA